MCQKKFVGVHLMQTVPPSCLNRDDMGSPKTATYGGVRRARVSSQSWKHAMRLLFPEIYGEEMVGKRTMMVTQMVADEIVAESNAYSMDAALKMAAKALTNAGIKLNADNNSSAMFFMSQSQAKALAELAIAGSEDKKAYKAAIQENPAIDMALFGRMVASDPSLNYDAAVQVAHAISTHAVQTEYDYFTAVDDLAPEDTTVTRHLGTIEYNSSTMYRYAAVDVQALEKYLDKEQAAKAVSGFIKAMICSMPSGHQNSFANATLPFAVYATVRHDQPISLCGAFEKPIPASSDGYEKRSAEALVDYANELYSTFTAKPDLAFTIGQSVSALGQNGSLSELLEWVEKAVCDGGNA